MMLKITPLEAAHAMGVGDMFIRVGLREGVLPFGVAVQNTKKKTWRYHISAAKLAEYQGISVEKLEEIIREQSAR